MDTTTDTLSMDRLIRGYTRLCKAVASKYPSRLDDLRAWVEFRLGEQTAASVIPKAPNR